MRKKFLQGMFLADKKETLNKNSMLKTYQISRAASLVGVLMLGMGRLIHLIVRINTMFKKIAVFTLAAAGCLHQAQAASVTWYLSGVSFNDGGTAAGSFVYDVTSNVFSNIDITTTGGSIRAGSNYSFATGVGTSTFPDFLDPNLPVINNVTERFDLFLLAAMSDAGGTISFQQADEFTCLDGGCTYVTGAEANLNLRRASGFISTTAPVPEPSTITLLGLGLASAAALRRRQIKAKGVMAS
jgi:hypothetical protein